MNNDDTTQTAFSNQQQNLGGLASAGAVGVNAGNAMRQAYRQLTDAEKNNMASIKAMGNSLHSFIDSLGNSREISLAKTKVEEAVMWAVKGITG